MNGLKTRWCAHHKLQHRADRVCPECLRELKTEELRTGWPVEKAKQVLEGE